MFSIEPQNVNDPNNYGDKPQMGILMAYTGFTAAAPSLRTPPWSQPYMEATDPDTGSIGKLLNQRRRRRGKNSPSGLRQGALSFIAELNFELPTDTGGNVYLDVTDFQPMLSDGHGGIDTQDIAVTVQNVAGATINGTAG